METMIRSSPESGHEDDDDDEFVDAPESKKSSSSDKKKDYFKSENSEKKDKDSASKKLNDKVESDRNVPLEKLAEDEKQLVTEKYLEARSQEVDSELQTRPANDPSVAEVLANAALLQELDRKLASGELLDDQALDQAVADTAKELGIEPSDANETEEVVADKPKADETSGPARVETDDEAPLETNEDQNIPDKTELSDVPTKDVPTTPPDILADESEEEDPVDPPVISPPHAPPVPPIPPVPGGPGGPSGHPAGPPHRPYGPLVPPIPAFPAAAIGPSALPLTPNIAPNVIVKHSAALPYLVVGYLLGRRRGRIKTEKKLLPVQKKLEQEVTTLHKNIALREEKLRHLVRNQVANKPAAAEQIVNRLERRDAKKLKNDTASQNKPITNQHNPEIGTASGAKLNVSPKTRANSEKLGNILLSPQVEVTAPLLPIISAGNKTIDTSKNPSSLLPTEQFISEIKNSKPVFENIDAMPEQPFTSPSILEGIAVIAKHNSATSPKQGIENKSLKNATMVQSELEAKPLKIPERPKAVQAMTVNELLLVAEHISVEQSSVAKLFRSNRLDQDGLRRVTRAYLRGERIEKVVHENLLKTTENFESDPGSPRTSPVSSLGNNPVVQHHSVAGPVQSSQGFGQEASQNAWSSTLSPRRQVTKKSTQLAVPAIIVVVIIALLFLVIR